MPKFVGCLIFVTVMFIITDACFGKGSSLTTRAMYHPLYPQPDGMFGRRSEQTNNTVLASRRTTSQGTRNRLPHTTPESFVTVGYSSSTVTSDPFGDDILPSRGLSGSIRGYGSPAVDLSLDAFGYFRVVEGTFSNLWTSNLMVSIGPRFYLRHKENLSGFFVGTGLGVGLKSIQIEKDIFGIPLDTEVENFLAITGVVSLGFNLMLSERFGVEAAYYRTAELISGDKFRYRQFTLGLTFGLSD